MNKTLEEIAAERVEEQAGTPDELDGHENHENQQDSQNGIAANLSVRTLEPEAIKEEERRLMRLLDLRTINSLKDACCLFGISGTARKSKLDITKSMAKYLILNQDRWNDVGEVLGLEFRKHDEIPSLSDAQKEEADRAFCLVKEDLVSWVNL